MSAIVDLRALEILDSRGNPTIQVTAHLANAVAGVAKVPSGASTGKREAYELRDGDPMRFKGKGVRKAVANVTGEILTRLRGMEVDDQAKVDQTLIDLDGTPNKSRLGANALLGVSLAVARARANEEGVPLYIDLNCSDSYVLPVPMLNVLNGGKHADNNVDFQEFMIVPVGAPSLSEALRAAAETFHALKARLAKKGYSTAVGDEGGFAPNLRSNEEAVDLLLESILAAGYKPGTDVGINLDPAASEFYEDGHYVLAKSGQGTKTSEEIIEFWTQWVKRYPEIYSLEDGLAEDDWDGWARLTSSLGKKMQIMGDDIFVTNPEILQRGIDRSIANSILIKLNQIGTLTETLACINLAHKNGYTAVISHRSGETDDTTIADLAVATGVGQLKTGSVCRGERVSKYNRLIEIEQELGAKGRFAGISVYNRWKSGFD